MDLMALVSGTLDETSGRLVSSSRACSSPGLVVGEPAGPSGVLDDPAPLVEAGDDWGSAAVEMGARRGGLRSRLAL